MPTPSSGQISFLNLKNAFGTGDPVSFSQLYRGGTYVPDITPDNTIPTSGTIAIDDFYGTWGRKTLSFTVTVGASTGKGKKGSLYGYGLLVKGATFGSISNNTFLTPGGTMTIEGLYYSTGSSSWHLQLSSTSAPANTDLSFRSVSVSGYSINGIRSTASSTQTVGTARRWNWVVKSTAHPTSGTITCTLNYYG